MEDVPPPMLTLAPILAVVVLEPPITTVAVPALVSPTFTVLAAPPILMTEAVVLKTLAVVAVDDPIPTVSVLVGSVKLRTALAPATLRDVALVRVTVGAPIERVPPLPPS